MATETEHDFMSAEAQDEHRWLQRLLGAWSYQAVSPGEPGGTPFKAEGTEHVRPIGDLWVVLEGRGKMPDGGDAQTVMTLGYDPERRRYLGTWIGSMMTHMWVYDGEVEGDTLTLHTVGPDMSTKGKLAKYKEVLELQGDDARVFSSHMQRDDGSWQEIMSARYRREA